MAAVPPELVAGGDQLLQLLQTQCPAPITPALVHGDYRLGNILSQGTEPVALIDWEIWSAGDPRVELGWFLVFADGSNFPGVGREVAGLPSTDELIALYTDGGEPLSRPRPGSTPSAGSRWPRSWATTCVGIVEGRHHDPDQEKLPATIDRLIDTGTALLDR